jgi:hypothetical protein
MMKKRPMKKKGYAKGGMKKKGYAKGGMKKKGYAKGGMKKKGYSEGGVSTIKPKKKPGSGLKKTSRSTAKANKIAAMWIKHHKETNTDDFKKASSILQDYVKQINKKKAKENK